MGMFDPEEAGWIRPKNLDGLMYEDLPNRLRSRGKQVGEDGYLNAERLMNNAADIIEDLIKSGHIILDKKK